MDKCVLYRGYGRLGNNGEMAWRGLLLCLCKTATNGVRPAVSHGQGVVGLWEDRNAFLSMFYVSCIRELVGIDTYVTVMVMCDHTDRRMPVIFVLWISWTEVMVDGVEERVSIECCSVYGVLASDSIVCCECFDA